MRRYLAYGSFVVASLAIAAIVGTYLYSGFYGLNTVLRLGGTVWVEVDAEDRRLSRSMRVALAVDVPAASAGDHQWLELIDGIEVTELPIIAGEQEVDRVLLTRLDPARYQISVLTEPAGDVDLEGWLEKTGSVAIINGSFFGPDGGPQTPLISNGVALGPKVYSATHGALVVRAGDVSIRDLKTKDWRALFEGANQAMVSYPLLVAPDGSQRTKSNARWLANRSFVAIDRSGRVILGTTKDAFFSLERLSLFLQRAPLGLSVALNLDGGPLACQGVQVMNYRRAFCGSWETSTHDGETVLLQTLFDKPRWGLPIVLAVTPR